MRAEFWAKLGTVLAFLALAVGCIDKVADQPDAAAALDTASADGGADTTATADVATQETTPEDAAAADSAMDTTGDAADGAGDSDISSDSGSGSDTDASGDSATDSSGDGDTSIDASFDADSAGEIAQKVCPANCATQSFGNPCLVGKCVGDVCVGTPIGTATKCDDGNDCTKGDTCCLPGDKFCAAGSCKSGGNVCECQGTDDSECEATKGDGNACNGKLYCDTSVVPFKCKPTPGSAVLCPESTNPCATKTCQTATGLCIDKPVVDGQSCDPGDPCLVAACAAGKCEVSANKCPCAINADCAKQEDGDACNGFLYCDKSVPGKNQCKLNPATIVTCGTGNDTACLKNVCAPATGLCAPLPSEWVDCSGGTCKPLPPGQPPKTTVLCDDGDKCTNSDTCQAGVCKSGTAVCPCKVDADCAKQEDGNPCNGTLFCDKAQNSCKLNPATIVKCPELQSFCSKSVCQFQANVADSAACVVVGNNEGSPCNDGSLCTGGDHCEKGDCLATTNVCSCSKDSDCAKQEDGDLCNGTLVCDLSQKLPKCVVNPATIVACPDPTNLCQAASCDKATGNCSAVNKADNTICDADGSACTAFDSCVAGACKAGVSICGCQDSADCSKFEDGNLCNGTLFCDLKQGACKVNPATIKTCPAALGQCTAYTCDPITAKCALVPVKEGDACDADGNLCTPGDVCEGGACSVGVNVCGCQSDAECKLKDDGNLCNGTVFCDKSEFPAHCATKAGSAIVCSGADDPCQPVICNPTTGKCAPKPKPEGTPCDDGKPCTVGDTCSSGQCLAGTDTCNCTTSADCKNDGNLCNGTATCVGGTCKTSDPFTCPKVGTGCVQPSCVPATGQCSDAPGTCDDNSPCTFDSCDTATKACQFKPFGEGSPCAATSVCLAGACTAVNSDQLPIGGTFWMGCNSLTDPECQTDEFPQHQVTVSLGAIDRTEVTVGQYSNCVKSGACTPAGTGEIGDGACNTGLPASSDRPINCVTVAQAEAFCTWKKARLPTEAEWELAARGPCLTANCKTQTPRYVWGNLPLPSCAQTWMFGSVFSGCNQGITLAVSSEAKDKSASGVFDLAGNVSEWTADGYDSQFYASAAATKNNPQAPASAKRTVRGGGGGSKGFDVRISARKGVDATSTSAWIGLRCATTLGKP